MERLTVAFGRFDELNSEDPRKTIVNGKPVASEVLYAQRMSERLENFAPDASQVVKLAARAQHICRWKKPRETYPPGRVGYLKWRTDLGQMHANLAGEVLSECGFDANTIERVQKLLMKKALKADPEVQLLEDVICLVFVEHYLEDFMQKHPQEKIDEIVIKTLRKMSEMGRAAVPSLPLSEPVVALWKRLTSA